MLKKQSKTLLIISAIWQIWLGISVFLRVMQSPYFEPPKFVSRLPQWLYGGPDFIFFLIIIIFVFFKTICIFCVKDIKKKTLTPLLILSVMLMCFSVVLNFDVFGINGHIILSFITAALALATAIFEIAILCNQKKIVKDTADDKICEPPSRLCLRSKITLIISVIWKIWFGIGILIGSPFYILSGMKITDSSVRFLPISGGTEGQVAFVCFSAITFLYVKMIFAFIQKDIKPQKRVLNYALTFIYSVGLIFVGDYIPEPVNYVFAISVLVLGAVLTAFEIVTLIKPEKSLKA